MKILAIDDDKCILNIIKEIFITKEGYQFYSASTGSHGIEILMKEQPDIVVLDLNLPDKNGYAICEMIRNKPGIFGNPMILMLTGEKDKEHIINGFAKGADDYLTKPFDFDELAWRIKALGKRKTGTDMKCLKYKDIIVDYENFIVYEDDKPLDIKRKECETLIYLIENKGRTISREKIMDEIWEMAYSYKNKTVDMTISRLKAKIKCFDENIETIKGIGYRLMNT